MPEQPMDLNMLRQIDAKLDALLDIYPELREPNPEREAALADWMQDHLQEDKDDATKKDR